MKLTVKIIFMEWRKVLIEQYPITGAVIKIPYDWEDPRNETMRNKVCDDYLINKSYKDKSRYFFFNNILSCNFSY